MKKLSPQIVLLSFVVLSLSFSVVVEAQTKSKQLNSNQSSNDSLFNKFVDELCTCLQRTSGPTDAMSNFTACANVIIMENEKDIAKLAQINDLDTGYDAQVKMGVWFAETLISLIVNNCDIFYKSEDVFLHNAVPVNAPDSVNQKLAVVNKLIRNGDSTESMLYIQCLLLRKSGNYIAAAAYFKKLFEKTGNPAYKVYGLVTDRRRKESELDK